MTQVKRLKREHLGIVIAEPSDLPIGSQGEFITADTLKPYLDEISTKATPAQIATAVNALETKILGGAGLDADTLAELNSKVVALQNLTDADKTGILDLLALKVNTTDIMPIVDAKADEESVASRLATKADESSVASRLATKATETSVAERLATKADEESVASRFAEKADETSVVSRLADKANESSVATRLDSKITSAQAEGIAQSIANALETKIMGGVGTDADTFAELKGLLDNLQSLSEADVNGVMTLLSSKLDKSVFDTYFTQGRTGGLLLSGLSAVTATDFVVQSMVGDLSSYPSSIMAADQTIFDQTTVVISSEANGMLRAMNFADFLDFIAKNPQSPIAQDISGKLSKEEFAQLFQAIPEDDPSYFFKNSSSIWANFMTQKRIAFDNDVAIKKLVVSDMQIDSLRGIGFDENGNFINPNDLSATQIINDLPDEGGDGFLHIMVVDAEEGFTKRVSLMQLMNVIAMNVNSPVNQMIADRDLTISELIARIQALEEMFESQPA